LQALASNTVASNTTGNVFIVFIVIELMLQIYEENPTYQHVKNAFIS